MNILIIHNSYKFPGGEETYTSTITSILRSHGHKVFIYSRDNKEIKTLWNKVGAAFSLIWSFKTVKDLEVIIKTFKPDIAQVHNVFPLISPSVYWILKKSGVPIVQFVSSYRYVCPKSSLFRNGSICEQCVHKQFYYPSIINRCYNNSAMSSFIISLSLFFHQHILKSFGFVDSFMFPSLFTQNYISSTVPGMKGKEVHIKTPTINKIGVKKVNKNNCFLYVGRLSEEKGVLLLLTLFSRNDFKRLKLIIVGNGPLKSTVQKSAMIHKNIIFAGNKSSQEIAELMTSSKALILPAQWFDVQPNVVLEALSHNLPVIAPKTPIFEEIVHHKKTGLLYESRMELIRYIQEISKNALATSKTDSKSLLKDHSEEVHYSQIIALYMRIKRNITLLQLTKK